eukprot:Seg237.4 transcript_id=Seg237.4/GoldUCD/mRNA.D3Y31 product="WASH complex subunit 3" protein_id=Seg237.4/GoldUCD/D3Y31
MDSNEPLVEIAVDDMTKVPAMPYKDFSAFFNPFVSHTVKFLNRFSCVCEEKLADLALRIQRLEITISLLETKLSSIPGLEDVKIETLADNQPQQTQPTSNVDTPSVATPSVSAQEEPQQEAPEPVKPARKTVAEDPRYAKYFKMIKMGVPVGALRSKMANEGLNPDLLEDPDAPMPDGGSDDDDDERSVSEGSSASSFSDDD